MGKNNLDFKAAEHKLNAMTKDERSLLLYLETRAVDHGGLVDISHMNSEDKQIARDWHDKMFLSYERLASECVTGTQLQPITHAVMLSEEAWTLAHVERRRRFERIYGKRTWRTTREKREALVE